MKLRKTTIKLYHPLNVMNHNHITLLELISPAAFFTILKRQTMSDQWTLCVLTLEFVSLSWYSSCTPYLNLRFNPRFEVQGLLLTFCKYSQLSHWMKNPAQKLLLLFKANSGSFIYFLFLSSRPHTILPWKPSPDSVPVLHALSLQAEQLTWWKGGWLKDSLRFIIQLKNWRILSDERWNLIMRAKCVQVPQLNPLHWDDLEMTSVTDLGLQTNNLKIDTTVQWKKHI